MARTYFSFFRMRFLALLQYRAAAIAGMTTNWVFGMMRVMVMLAFYASANRGQPISLEQSISYIWLGQLMLGMLPWTQEKEIMNSVVSGQVAYELTRPVDLYAMWFARTVAYRTAPTLMRAVPMYFICRFLLPDGYGLSAPTAAGFFAWLLALIGAVLLSVSITSLVYSYVLIIQRGDGLVRMLNAMAELFSGMIIPLSLMPDSMEMFLKYQPFAGVVDLPVRLYCGITEPSAVWQVLAIQLAWSGLLILAGRAVTNIGLKRIALAGG